MLRDSKISYNSNKQNRQVGIIVLMQRLFINNHPHLESFSYIHRAPENRDSSNSSPALVFAHATGFNALTYRQLFNCIDSTVEIFALDQRGHGLTTAPANEEELKSWSTYERDLAEFVNWLNRPVVLAGHSMGGAVSTKVAAQKPQLVKGLILVEPVIMPPLADPVMDLIKKYNLGNFIPMVKSAINRQAYFSSIEKAVENYTGKGAFKTWPKTWIEDYVTGGTVKNNEGGISLSCKPKWEARTFAVSGNRPWSAILKLSCPISVIKGAKGSTFHPAAVRRLLKLHPETDYTLIKEASHFVPMEEDEKVGEIINDVLIKIKNNS